MYIYSKQYSAFRPFIKGEAFLAPSTIYMQMPSELMMMPPYFIERAPSMTQFEPFDSPTPALLIKKNSVQLEAPQPPEAPAVPKVTASPSKKSSKSGKKTGPKKSDKR